MILRATAVLTVVFGLLASAHAANALRTSIEPDETWPDNRGRHIQAHGGILHDGDTYYWFGEDRGGENRRRFPRLHPVACYSSKDLMNWTFRRQVVDGKPPESFPSGNFILERPKVFHNAKTGKYVMYAHLDNGAIRMRESAYTFATPWTANTALSAASARWARKAATSASSSTTTARPI